MNPENPNKENNETTPEVVGSYEEQEASLSNEIVEELAEYEENLEQVESLVEDETISDSMKERVLSSIDKISDELQTKFLMHFGGSAIMGGALGLQEYLIQTQQTIVEQGSLLADGNQVAIAGVAMYATVKSLQFAADKFKAFGVKRLVNKGTVEGAEKAASYITNEGGRTEISFSRELDINAAEHLSMYDEAWKIHTEESGEVGRSQRNSELKRIRTEASQVLAS